jgi:hypothetical protein
MASDDPSRKVTLTFGGEAFADGRVPLTLLAEKLKALQALLFHAAATVTHDKIARRGQWANRYRDAVELRFAESRTGSLVIEAKLPGSVAPVLGDQYDLGREAVKLANEFAASVEREDTPGLAKLVPDRQERALLLRSVEALAPDPAETYTLSVANGSPQHAGVSLSGATRRRARALLQEQAMDEADAGREVTIVGTLTKIHYEVSPEKIAVRVGPGNEIDCFYDDALRDQIANLCAGGIVEVIGIATLDVEGRIRQIDSVTAVEAVSMEPVRISRFDHGGRSYKLREAALFTIEFTEGVWAYANEALGVRGYAARRADALRELHEAFDYAYQDIALAEDDALIGRAIEMQREFERLVEAGGGGHS